MLGKKVLIVLYIFTVLYALSRVFNSYTEYGIPYVAVRSLITSFTIINVVMGLLIFFAVYADDFKSMSYVTAIGRGISRDKIVLAKLCDVIILSFILYGICAIVMTGYITVAGCSLNHTLAKAWWLTFFISFYKTFGYIALSTMILYVTNNVPLGTIVLMLLYLAVPLSGMIFGLNEAVAKLHLERLHFAGLADNASADIMFGMNGIGIMKLVFGAVVYAGIVILVTRILFRKRELDF